MSREAKEAKEVRSEGLGGGSPEESLASRCKHLGFSPLRKDVLAGNKGTSLSCVQVSVNLLQH